MKTRTFDEVKKELVGKESYLYGNFDLNEMMLSLGYGSLYDSVSPKEWFVDENIGVDLPIAYEYFGDELPSVMLDLEFASPADKRQFNIAAKEYANGNEEEALDLLGRVNVRVTDVEEK